MFSPEDDPEAEAVAKALLERGNTEMVRALEEIGVYVTDIAIVGREGAAGGVELALGITAILGRVAFRDRVQRPDQEAVDAAFEQLTEQMADDDFERRRRELGG